LKIYTRTGDSGETALFGGGRVPKDHPRVDACGAIDELNAFIGHAIGVVEADHARMHLSVVQHDLFSLGSHLASPPVGEGEKGPDLPRLPDSRPDEMEAWIDEEEAKLTSLDAFILPGGSAGARALHLCRTVCRRAERSTVSVAREDSGASFAVTYLNRLSDLLFVLARVENHAAGVRDIHWQQEP